MSRASRSCITRSAVLPRARDDRLLPRDKRRCFMELVQVRIKENVVVISLLLYNFNAVIKSSVRILCSKMLSCCFGL